jgi:hypothetical protein
VRRPDPPPVWDWQLVLVVLAAVLIVVALLELLRR